MLKNLLVGTSAIILAACGGSDTTTSPPPPPPPPSSSANQSPVVATANADQNEQVGFDVNYDATQGGTTFTDADGDTLTITVSFNPANGLVANGGTITGKPATLNDVTVTVTANDGKGGTATDTFIINVGVDQDAVQAKFNGNIDLTDLPSYENPVIPGYINKLTENGNPITDAGAILGRVLFYDTALSIDDTISCASCHIQSEAFGDITVVSEGVLGGETRRHSMRLINTQYAVRLISFGTSAQLVMKPKKLCL